MGREKKICEYLHIPLQAGSNTILKKMNRKYTLEEYMDKINLAKEKIKDLAISSDFIVGFPGETADDFQKTLEAIEWSDRDKYLHLNIHPDLAPVRLFLKRQYQTWINL